MHNFSAIFFHKVCNFWEKQKHLLKQQVFFLHSLPLFGMSQIRRYQMISLCREKQAVHRFRRLFL